MRVFLFFFAGAAGLVGLALLAKAQSAIHESEAFIVFLISAVFLTGAGVVDVFGRIRNEVHDGIALLRNQLQADRSEWRAVPLVRKPLGGK